jgi:hypothetical protein
MTQILVNSKSCRIFVCRIKFLPKLGNQNTFFTFYSFPKDIYNLFINVPHK